MRTVLEFAWRAAGTTKWWIFAGSFFVLLLSILDAVLVWAAVDAAQGGYALAAGWLSLVLVRLVFNIAETSLSQGLGKVPRSRVAEVTYANLLKRGERQGAAASKTHSLAGSITEQLELAWYAINGLVATMLVMLVVIYLTLGLLAVGGFIVCLLLTGLFVWRQVIKRRQAMKELAQAEEALANHVVETFNAGKALHVHGLVQWSIDKYKALNRRFERATVREASYVARASAALNGVSDFLIVLVVWLGSEQFGLSANTVLLVAQFLKMRHLVTAFHSTINRIQHIGEQASVLEPDIIHFDPGLLCDEVERQPFTSGGPLIIKGPSFGYSERLVIDSEGADFRLLPATVTVLRGESGVGKTTLVWLAIGLLEPSKGEISIGGMVPNEHSRRREIAVTTPDDYIDKDATIRHALAWLVPGGVLRDECLEEALWAACLDEVVDSYDDIVREKVSSSGLAGRMRVARAALKVILGAKVFVLDEPTANLDPVTTDVMIGRIVEFARRHKVVCVVVTHSPIVTKYADRVIVLHGGVLREVQE